MAAESPLRGQPPGSGQSPSSNPTPPTTLPPLQDAPARAASRLLELKECRGLQGQALTLQEVLTREAEGLARTIVREAAMAKVVAGSLSSES